MIAEPPARSFIQQVNVRNEHSDAIASPSSDRGRPRPRISGVVRTNPYDPTFERKASCLTVKRAAEGAAAASRAKRVALGMQCSGMHRPVSRLLDTGGAVFFPRRAQPSV